MPYKRHIIVLSLLFFLIPLHSYAEKLEMVSAGQVAYAEGDYETALTLWRTAAEQGSSNAQVLVGLAYANGWGIKKDIRAAEMWYHIAAENNNPTGQFLLALYYIASKPEQFQAGIMWLKRSAENGDVSAQGFLVKAQQKHWFDNIERWTVASRELAGQKFAAVR